MKESPEILSTPEARITHFFQEVHAKFLNHAAGLVVLGGQLPDDQTILRLRYEYGTLQEAAITQQPIEGESSSFKMKLGPQGPIDFIQIKQWASSLGASESMKMPVINLDTKKDLLDIFGILGTTYIKEGNYSVFPDNTKGERLGGRVMRWVLGQKRTA